MKSYKFVLEIFEGNDEFWESHAGRTGCDDVYAWIKDTLEEDGVLLIGENCSLRLVSFKDNYDEC